MDKHTDARRNVTEIKSEADLFGAGAAPGSVPTDIEQSTGLERLEILGKMEGVDIFDMRPLDSSRKGTLDSPIMVKSAGDEQYAGCTGSPADSHVVNWLGVRPQVLYLTFPPPLHSSGPTVTKPLALLPTCILRS